MEMNDFFITLPSNVGSNTPVDNTASYFRTTLPERIVLDGNWSVALVEISYLHTFNNLQNTIEGANKISIITADKRELSCFIPPGYYATINALLDTINQTIKNIVTESILPHVENEHEMSVLDKIPVIFSYDFYLKRVILNYSTKTVHSVKMSEQIKYMLGFDDLDSKNKITMIRSRSRGRFQIVAKHPFDLYSGQYSFFVYCDLIQNQIVGNIRAPLLQIVPIKGSHNELVMHSFTTPHYVPVLKKSFDTVEISIKNDLNTLVPFDFGKTIVKLHFKKMQSLPHF